MSIMDDSGDYSWPGGPTPPEDASVATVPEEPQRSVSQRSVRGAGATLLQELYLLQVR
jgi:hypothetical protein